LRGVAGTRIKKNAGTRCYAWALGKCEVHVRTQEHERLAHARMHGLARIHAWQTHALQEETAGGRGAYVLRGEGGSSRVGS